MAVVLEEVAMEELEERDGDSLETVTPKLIVLQKRLIPGWAEVCQELFDYHKQGLNFGPYDLFSLECTPQDLEVAESSAAFLYETLSSLGVRVISNIYSFSPQEKIVINKIKSLEAKSTVHILNVCPYLYHKQRADDLKQEARESGFNVRMLKI